MVSSSLNPAEAITALLVARDAPNFAVVEGMVAIALFAGLVIIVGLISRR